MTPNSLAKFACHRSRLVAVASILLVAGPAAPVIAQTPPPAQGTVALEGTMKRFYQAANVVVVATIDGVEHAFRFAGDLLVHGGKGAGPDALAGLREGSTVVVHYAANAAGQTAQEIDVVGDAALKVTEGTVTRLDRRHQQITVRYEGGKTETFRLTDLAAAEAPKDAETEPGPGKVAIYYSDERGQKIVHYFKRLP
jgi:hypothetical protein